MNLINKQIKFLEDFGLQPATFYKDMMEFLTFLFMLFGVISFFLILKFNFEW